MLLFLRLFAAIPLWAAHGLGTLLGWLVYGASPTYRRNFRDNVQQAGLTPTQARAAVGEAGKLVAELPWVWLRPIAFKETRTRWVGQEHVDAAYARGKGVIFMTPHFGCYEMTPLTFVERFARSRGPMTILYRPSRKPWFDRLLKVVRSPPGLQPVPASTGGVRLLLKALKQGQAIGMLPDQVPPEGMGVWAPFFGRRAYTMTLGLRLARQSGAALLLAWGDRLPWGRGFVVHVQPLALPIEASDDAGAHALNAALERLILQRPDLYLWGYARYKQPRPHR